MDGPGVGRGVVAVAGVRRISGGGCVGSWRVREGSLELDPEPPSRVLRVGARPAVSGIGGGCGEPLSLEAERPLGRAIGVTMPICREE